MKNKYIYKITLIIAFFWSFSSFAQTGPGGVGKADGTSNLVLWLNANSNSNSNTSWNDDSGKGYDFTGGTGAPLNTDVNGYKSYTFGGTDFFEKSFELVLNPLYFSVFTANKVMSSTPSRYKAVFSNRDDYPQRGFMLYSRPSSNIGIIGLVLIQPILMLMEDGILRVIIFQQQVFGQHNLFFMIMMLLLKRDFI